MSRRYLTLILVRDIRRFFWINTLFMGSFIGLILLSWTHPYIHLLSILWAIILIVLNYILINRFYTRKIEAMTKEFHSKMSNAASIDDLTKIYNRRAGMMRLDEEFAGARRRQEELTIAMIDIDNFKKINDTYGHLAGDAVISYVANEIKNNLRENDIVFRYGGEEFLAILPNAGESKASLPLERIRRLISKHTFNFNNQHIRTSVSIGIASIKEDEREISETIARADEALYRAKRTGKNRLVLSSEPLKHSLPPGKPLRIFLGHILSPHFKNFNLFGKTKSTPKLSILEKSE